MAGVRSWQAQRHRSKESLSVGSAKAFSGDINEINFMVDLLL